MSVHASISINSSSVSQPKGRPFFHQFDLQELVHLSHRIYVMHEGHCTAELDADQISEERVIAYAFGEKPKEDIQQ